MSKGHKIRMDKLRRAAAHLDQVTLDRAWDAALRGDMEAVEEVLGQYVAQAPTSRTTSWRNSSSWLFGRTPFNRKLS